MCVKCIKKPPEVPPFSLTHSQERYCLTKAQPDLNVLPRFIRHKSKLRETHGRAVPQSSRLMSVNETANRRAQQKAVMLRPRKTPLHNYARCAALHRQEACACGQEAANFATGKRKQDSLRYNTNTTEGIQMSLWRKHKYHQIFMGQPMRCSADGQQGLRLNFLLLKKKFHLHFANSETPAQAGTELL